MTPPKTSFELAMDIIDFEEGPIDWFWIRYQKRIYTVNQLKDICRRIVDCFYSNLTKQKAGRIAGELYRYLYCR